MAKRFRISGDELSVAVNTILTEYNDRTVDRVNAAAEKAVKRLVKITQETAPKRTGLYRKKIACELREKKPTGETWVWYVKPPRHRVTHLLVHGHAKRGGGRTRSDPFLKNAIAQVEPEFNEAVEAAGRGETE